MLNIRYRLSNYNQFCGGIIILHFCLKVIKPGQEEEKHDNKKFQGDKGDGLSSGQSILKVMLHGRRSIWQSRKVTLVAPHIVKYCKTRFMCEQDQSREPNFVAGAVFGEVGG